MDVRDVEELKVVEAGNRSANCIYARVVFISFRYSGSERKERLVPLRDYVGQMVNGAGGVVQQLQSQLQGQSGDQTGIQSELELRQSQAIDFSFIRNGGAKKEANPCKQI